MHLDPVRLAELELVFDFSAITRLASLFDVREPGEVLTRLASVELAQYPAVLAALAHRSTEDVHRILDSDRITFGQIVGSIEAAIRRGMSLEDRSERAAAAEDPTSALG